MMMVARDVGHFDESTGHIAARVQQNTPSSKQLELEHMQEACFAF
jgi:hypothetical protein